MELSLVLDEAIHVWVLSYNKEIGGYSTFSTAAKVILSILSSHANEHLSCRDSPTCFFFYNLMMSSGWRALVSLLKEKVINSPLGGAIQSTASTFGINLKICKAKFLFLLPNFPIFALPWSGLVVRSLACRARRLGFDPSSDQMYFSPQV